jgi:hypothetical protein
MASMGVEAEWGTVSGVSTLNTVDTSAAIGTGVGGFGSGSGRSSLRRESAGSLAVVVEDVEEKEEMPEGEKAEAEKEEGKEGKRGKDEDIETRMEEEKAEAGLGIAMTMADGTQARSQDAGVTKVGG